MKLEYFILGILKLKPQSGYDIKILLDTEGRYLRPSTPLSQIYTTLKRMNADGWVQFVEEPQSGKPDKKNYSVSPAGEMVLREWLMAPYEPSFRFQDREFLGKLFFSFLLDRKTVLQHCQAELNYRKAQIAQYRDRDRKLPVSPETDFSQTRLQWMVDKLHDYGKGSVDQYVIWLENFIGELEMIPDEAW